MFGYYTPILLLQAFCLYHAYRHGTQQKWFWLIVFLPLIGSLVYLYQTFYNRSNVEGLTEGVKGIINSNYHLERLEKAYRFADTVDNKIRLADAYLALGRVEEAIPLYRSGLEGFNANDTTTKSKLLKAYYLQGNHAGAVRLGEELASDKLFAASEERVAYAWALHHTGYMDKARLTFKQMDVDYSNYVQRREYVNYLVQIGEKEEARTKLVNVLEEFDNMEKHEKRHHAVVRKELKKLLYDLEKSGGF